jgi:hypothetical protein
VSRRIRLEPLVFSSLFVLACSGASDAEPGGAVTGGASGTGGATVSEGGTGGTAGKGGSGASTGAGGSAKTGGGTGAGGSTATGGSTVTGGGAGAGGSTEGGTFRLPTANAQFDYQIGGGYAPPAGVAVVSRDRNDSPAPGLYNICYVNGFQAQPDEESFWTSSHPDLLLRDSGGNVVVDTDWNEMLLDVRTPEKRTALAAIVGGWIQKCAADGFDAVEIDNLDSYSRSQGLLTQAENVAFMGMLSAIAHASGLAAAQKNSTELLGSVSQMGTDFAVAEECNRYSECDQYQAAYGNLVFVIEYRDQDFAKGCTDFPELSIVRRDVNVTKPGSASYVYQAC